MMNAVAIVPAYNEERTIGPVVKALLDSRSFKRVLVVSDGSVDRTAEIARDLGADVLELKPNRGKGGAMLEAMRQTNEPVVAFFDADLLGFRPDHAQKLLDPVVSGEACMCVGLRDYKGLQNKLQSYFPPITGERAALREVFEAVPASFWKGFRIEAGINRAATLHPKPVKSVIFDGVSIVLKWQKVGAQKGIEDMTKMARDVIIAMAEAQHIKPAAAAETSSSLPSSTPSSNAIRVMPDGRIEGADGLLEQISSHVARQVRLEILPEIQRDIALQERVGLAIGRGASEGTSFWLKALTVVGVIIAYKLITAEPAAKKNPTRMRRPRRTQR